MSDCLYDSFLRRVKRVGLLLRRESQQSRAVSSSDWKLTRGSALRHIRNIAIPAAVGLFCNTLFNITDTFYAGWLATDAQAALAFAFPLYFIQLSCCIGILQAIASKVAGAVGGGGMIRARRLVGQGMLLAATICAVIWLILLPFADTLLGLLGARGQVRDWAEEYTSIIFLGAPAFIFAFALNGALHAVGNTTAFRNGIIAATLANVILDPALMFGWFGLPALGMAGIATATVLAQTGMAMYMLSVLVRTPMMRRWRWQLLKPRWTIYTSLAKAAIAPTGRMLCINTGFFIITGFLGYFSDAAVAGYGIALRLEQLFLLPTIGMEAAMIAYCGQNFGARQPARALAAYRICFTNGMWFMGIGAVVMLLFGEFMVGLFNSDEDVLREGRRYLWLAAASGPLYVILNIAGAVFLAAGRHKIILLVNIARLTLAPAAFSFLLAIWLEQGVGGVWISVFVCNAFAMVFMHQRCMHLLREMVGRRASLEK